MSTTPLIDRASAADAVMRLEVADRKLSHLEEELRELWHHLVVTEPVLAARVRVAANHLRNAATALNA